MPIVWFNHGLSCLRDAARLIRRDGGPDVRVMVSHRDPSAPTLRAADIAVIEPAGLRLGGDDVYVDWLLETARAHRVDLFIPQAARSAVSGYRTLFLEAGVRVSVPAGPCVLEAIDNKAVFYGRAADEGLPVPRVMEVGTPEAFDIAVADIASAGYDVSVKPPRGVFGAGFWRLDSGCSPWSSLMDPDARRVSPAVMRAALGTAPEGSKLLVMEHLPGDEWSVDCVADNGRTIVGMARRKKGRVQLLEPDGPALALAVRTVTAFGLSGLVNIQMKADRNGVARLLEINPRMSGGCAYGDHAGLNLPWIAVGLALGVLDGSAVLQARRGVVIAPVQDAVSWAVSPG